MEDTLLCHFPLLSTQGRENSIPPPASMGKAESVRQRGAQPTCVQLLSQRGAPHPKPPSPNRTKQRTHHSPKPSHSPVFCCHGQHYPPICSGQKCRCVPDATSWPHPSHQQVPWPLTPKHSPRGSYSGVHLAITSSRKPSLTTPSREVPFPGTMASCASTIPYFVFFMT